MRRHRLSRLHLGLILLLMLLVLSATSTLGQGAFFASKTPYPVSSSTTQSVSVPEAKILPHPVGGKPLMFASSQEQNAWRVRFTSRDIGHQLLPTNNKALPGLRQLARRTELGVNANHSIGNAPSEWLVDGVPEGGTPYPKFYLDSDDLHYHAHPISSARSIILLFDELAQSHSKITHLFELLDPQLSFGRKRSPREQYKH